MGKVNVNTVQLGAMQSAAAVALMPLLIFFIAYTAAATQTQFNGTDNPSKLTLPLEHIDPI